MNALTNCHQAAEQDFVKSKRTQGFCRGRDYLAKKPRNTRIKNKRAVIILASKSQGLMEAVITMYELLRCFQGSSVFSLSYNSAGYYCLCD